MLSRTHVAISIFFILALLSHVENKIVFTLIVLAVTFVPDVDSRFSKMGQRKIFRPLQWLAKHRGIFHSFTFLFIFNLFFVLFLPVVALPFFLAYSLHLLADSFTVDGIQPFYPSSKTVSWKIRTGGKTEMSVFVLFVLADAFLFLVKVLSF